MRTIEGLIHVNIPGFNSPIVQLFSPRVRNVSEYDYLYQRVGSHLLSQGEIIPIDSDCMIIDSNYTCKEL